MTFKLTTNAKAPAAFRQAEDVLGIEKTVQNPATSSANAGTRSAKITTKMMFVRADAIRNTMLIIPKAMRYIAKVL